MSAQLARILVYAFIAFLFLCDRKRRSGCSNALWIPLLWVLILGSRPFSSWFGGGVDMETTDDYIEGSPVDRLVFLFLIIAGFIVLKQRQTNWGNVFRTNKWLFVFFAYLGLSSVWSDFPMVSFKRWIKDLGNIIMVLVVLSEKNPVEAVKTLLLRCCYLLVPLSVLYIKYFPDIGRGYNRWTGEVICMGVTTAKNMLGITVLACFVGIFWYFVDGFDWKARDKKAMGAYMALLALTGWLLITTNSATSLACSILAAGILIGMKVPAVQKRVKYLEAYVITFVLLLLVGQALFNSGEALAGTMGRDLTFTGRVDIWKRVLKEDINPLIGTGYYSFWMGDRVDRISEGFYFHLNEAHNGYIETYLNSGLVGVALLLVALYAASRRIKADLLRGEEFAKVRLIFLAVGVVYNLTEAAFNKLSLLWILMLLVVAEYPPPRRAKVPAAAKTSAAGPFPKGSVSGEMPAAG
jgi:exopolysaccharide production protein ExoQ